MRFWEQKFGVDGSKIHQTYGIFFWRTKYTLNVNEENLIRWNDHLVGSIIEQASQKNQTLVQDHSFWEIKDGTITKFWMDSWQQIPILAVDQQWDDIQTNIPNRDMKKVANYQIDICEDHLWRKWEISPAEFHLLDQIHLDQWSEEMR